MFDFKDWSHQAGIMKGKEAELIIEKLSILETLVDYGFYWIDNEITSKNTEPSTGTSLEDPSAAGARVEEKAVPITIPRVIAKLINILGKL